MPADSDSGKRHHNRLRGNKGVLDLTGDNDQAELPIDLTQSDGEDDNDGEDEDEDLKLAIALSLQDQQEPTPTPPSATTSSHALTEATKSDTLASLLAQPQNRASSRADHGLFGLDRRQMEAERLARLKRKREPEVEPRPISPHPLRRVALSRVPATSASMAPSQPRPSSTLQYPLGKILLTSVNKGQRQSASLTDLLRPTDPKAPLKSALLSSYMFDFDWLLPHFDTRKVSFVLVLHARDNNHKTQLSADFAGIPNVRLTFPYVGGNVVCMHSKISILFYEQHLDDQKFERGPNRCRIIIPSANLVPWDYGVGSVMENTLFVIDLPPKESLASTRDHDGSDFKNNLVQFLRTTSTPMDVVKRLDGFDFAATATYGFVHTVGGSHILSNTSDKPSPGLRGIDPHHGLQTTGSFAPPTHTERTGMLALAAAVKSLGLSASSDDGSYPPRLDYVASSIGSLKMPFISNLFLAACGSTEKLLDRYRKNATSKRGKLSDATLADTRFDAAELAKRIRIYFPSEDTIRKSTGGPGAAGTLFFQPKWSDKSENEFLRNSLHDCIGARDDGVLMHSKVRYANFLFTHYKIEMASHVPHTQPSFSLRNTLQV